MKAIIRVAKLKTGGNIGGSGQHNYRENETLNADPSKTPNNQHLGCQNAHELLLAVEARIETVPNLRSNSVRCLEYLITASPEFFDKADGTQSRRGQYFNDSLAWLEAKHGKENIVATSMHLDEKTPHLVAYVVPIDSAGRLNARSFTGGRELLRGMQTDFADEVGKKHNLERGIEGSKARHEAISDYYARVNAPAPPAPSFADLVGLGKDGRAEEMRKIYAQNLDRERELRQKDDEIKRYHDEIKRYNAQIDDFKKRDDQHDLNEKRLMQATAVLMKNSYSPAEFSKHMGVELRGKADVFDALIREGRATNFVHAVQLVATKMPSQHKSSWSELAQWNLEYKNDPDDPKKNHELARSKMGLPPKEEPKPKVFREPDLARNPRIRGPSL